jgi:ADP-L-glycero-D-manno-heptose 6-epimerase
MILITGARGFVGSNLVKHLNEIGREDLVLVDELTNAAKNDNLKGLKYHALLDRDQWWEVCSQYPVSYVFHLGARTDTTEFDVAILDRLNLKYSKKVWNYCTDNNIPLVYASSAATYGDGAHGYDDDSSIEALIPLNPYGWSKQNFDLWIQSQDMTPPMFYGLKFFNVYGENENHKGRMASVIYHAYHQIKKEGKVKLFKSHHPDYSDGGQLRDFIYVKDIIRICDFLYKNKIKNGIYNCGTGMARTFLDLAISVFVALGKEPNIEYIDMPIDIRDKYQYYTEALMSKLKNAGCSNDFYSLEDGVESYVHYLDKR